MWRNTRYDLQQYSHLGLADSAITWGNPIRVSAGRLTRGGAPFYVNGHGLHAQTYGSIHATATRAEIDTLVGYWRDTGVNALSVMEMEHYGLAISGTQKGRPTSCWDNGYQWTTSKTWTAGDVCYTLDTSGFTRVTRRYLCDTGGAGATSGSGPTGTTATINGISDGAAAKWHYIGPAYESYLETFWTGDGNSAGFDYLMDACGRAGIYVMIRFDRWETVFQHLTDGYQCNGSSGVSGGNLSFHRMLWPLDGTSGTVDMMQGIMDHLDQWLTRVNSVNGRRYADDHTLLGFDVLNEQGLANGFFNSSDSASSNTWDYLCKAGSTTGGSTEPNSAIVAWWDAKFLAWYQDTYSSTPAIDYGKANTLPVYRYTGALGPNVAARDRYYAGSTAGVWVTRVARFLRETEAEFVTTIRDHVRSRSAHALFQAGQLAYVFPTTVALGDICDSHTYGNATNTSSNPVTDTITSGGGKGVSWVAGTLTAVFSAAPTRSLLVGQKVRVTQTSGGSWTEVVTIATVYTTTTANDSFTATGVADPVTIGGTQVSATVVLPTIDNNVWALHAATAGDTASTRMHYYDATAPGQEVNYDIAGWAGQSGLGIYNTLRDNYISGLATLCTERGERGLAGPQKGMHHAIYTLIDLLQGGSGSFNFAFANADVAPLVGEHNTPGDGSAWLTNIEIALMARCVSALPNTDTASAVATDFDAIFARRNSTDTQPTFVNGLSCGYAQFAPAAVWQSLWHKRLRLDIGSSSSSSVYSPTIASTGWTNPDLTDASTGLLFLWYNMGVAAYENAKCAIYIGRIPTDTGAAGPSPLPLPLVKLRASTIDGKAWYGRVMWLSLDGSDLGVGRSVLISYCYPRDEQQVARRFIVDSGTPRVEMLDGDMGPSTPDSAMQPGVVLRNGLEIRLTSPRALRATRYVQDQAAEYYAAYSGGQVYLQPRDPLIVLE